MNVLILIMGTSLMWLAVQYFGMFYGDNTFEKKDKVDKKKVTFKDEDEIYEIKTEYQIWERDNTEEDVEVKIKSVTFETRITKER